jgi:predicted nucleic acid-binding protein
MVAKKSRTRVVLDTNVFVRALKSKKPASPNQSVLRLWLMEKRLQLIVSADVVAEYLEIFEQVLVPLSNAKPFFARMFVEQG